MGRLIQASTTYSFLSGKTFTVAYGWDAASNLISMTDTQRGTTAYSYDTLSRLSALQNPQRDQFGFAYDALGRRIQLRRPNGIASNYEYDPLSRMTSIVHQFTNSKGVTTTLDGAAYTCDAAGNRASKTDKRTNLVSTFGYDPIYQLTDVTQGAATAETYAYDLVGNRIGSIGGSPFNYNSSNELTDQPGATFSYDNNGNLVSKTGSAGTTTYTWDFEDRLSAVTAPGGIQVSFKYDPFGRRIQKASSSGTTNYIYDRANIIQEVDTTGAQIARYTQGLAIDQPLAVLRGGTTSYFEADGLGSITSLSNASGALAKTYTYDSFGKVLASTGTVVNPFRFTGREFDSETGLYFYRARYYDANDGRFISEDPIGFKGGVNFYSYVANAPTYFIDPTGTDIAVIGTMQDILWWVEARNYLMQDPIMAEMIRRAEYSTTQYYIDMTRNDIAPDNWTKKKSNHIHWNPHLAIRACEGGKYQSPALGLGHELDHLLNGAPDESLKEEMRVINGSEAHAARTLGEPRRYDWAEHGGKWVASPTQH